MTKEFIDFVKSHIQEDTSRLLLSAARYPSIDMPAAVRQIEGMRVARTKWPWLLNYDEFLYPPRLNREQSSSETTAKYKAGLAKRLLNDSETARICDLTGGMGIDCIALAVGQPLGDSVCTEVDYVELNAELCSLMEHNRKVLGLENLHVHQADSMEWISSGGKYYDILYIDPARRSSSGHKVSAFEDCEPNIIEHLPALLDRCRWLMVKASPMIDISLAQHQLSLVTEIHILSIKGECKEVLFVCGQQEKETTIYCNGLSAAKGYEHQFCRSDELSAVPCFCTEVKQYLYEPDAALMKGGALNLICQWFGVEKLARNTQLYTSETHIESFPGRAFRVLGEIHLSRKEVSHAIAEGKAHVITRNYPVEAATLQRQLGLKEGGQLFIVATTVGTHKVGLLCCPATQQDDFLKVK